MPTATLADATKSVVVSVDSTMRSILSEGVTIHLVCYDRDCMEIRKRRFNEGDASLMALKTNWNEGIRESSWKLREL